MNARAWLWTCALLLALPVPALAESETKRAAELFSQGRAAMEREDFATACPKFAESARLDPAPGTILNLALCEEGLGKPGSALRHYRQVLRLLPPSDERVPFAKEHADAVEARAAKLTLVLSSDAPAGARVLHDGKEVPAGDLGAERPVDPGAHEVTLQVPGEDDQQLTLSLDEGERRTLVLRGRSAAPREDGGERGSPTAGLVVGGLGAASLATSLVLGVLVVDASATVDASCDGRFCDARGADAAATGSTLATISTITFFAGAAALGAGIYLVLSSDGDGASTALGPAPLPGGGGLRLRSTF